MLNTLNFYHSSLENLGLRKIKQEKIHIIYIPLKKLKTIMQGKGDK